MRILHVIMFCCFSASSVPLGSPPSTTIATTALQTEANTLPRGRFTVSTERSPGESTLPDTEGKTKSAAATLTDTTVVIIVSVSLAVLVCAIIPLIFYGHCRSSAEGHNKGEPDYCEENADVPQAAVRLQSVEPDAVSVSSIHDASQYAAAYQALDPKSLD